MSTYAIIGTAGRKDDAEHLYPDLYPAMVEKTWQTILELAKRPELTGQEINLVSGGAAWADHTAVKLFKEKKGNSLTLFLPCEYDRENRRFADTGIIDFRKNPGGTLNFYHKIFSKRTGINSLEEIGQAIENGARTVVVKAQGWEGGLRARNSKVAMSDAMVAITFGHGASPKSRGTIDTVQKYLERAKAKGLPNLGAHIDLNTMMSHTPLALQQEQRQAKFKATMYFHFGSMARPDIKAKTTFEAILNKERKSTTRYPEDPGYEKWKGLTPGDLIEVYEDRNMQGRSAVLRITDRPRAVNFKQMNDMQLEAWSKTEGWSKQYCKKQVWSGNRFEGVQIPYELVRVKEPRKEEAKAAQQPSLSR